MVTSHGPASHACNLLAQIIQDDDGAHVSQLIAFIDEIAEPGNEVANEAKQFLRQDRSGCPCEDGCTCL